MDQWMEEELIVEQEDQKLGKPLEEASRPFVGRWHRLVSQTNWEKGRIICQWRQALQQAGAPPSAYSDEAWSRLVGGVSPQHVGRLRRVYERFGQVAHQYAGLYWSHFLAALDWPDAEMWLEGAVQNRWSVARMQAQRAQTLGGAGSHPNSLPKMELHEDTTTSLDTPPVLMPEIDQLHAPEEDSSPAPCQTSPAGEKTLETLQPNQPPHQTPSETSICQTAPPAFADLPPMPEDIAEAFEAFKLAIVRHKLVGWKEISCRQVLKILEALKRFALAAEELPSEAS